MVFSVVTAPHQEVFVAHQYLPVQSASQTCRTEQSGEWTLPQPYITYMTCEMGHHDRT